MHGGGRRVGRRDGGERWEETAIQTSRFERARQRGVAGHLGETWRRGREAVEWREQRAHHTRLALSTERKGQSPTRVALAIRNFGATEGQSGAGKGLNRSERGLPRPFEVPMDPNYWKAEHGTPG